ncbi:hypothetical protein BWQ96_04781 [Gracilariopsis chorda]|uniref:BED-type domain-containing protein n=1 Tax=Gracilariopsis chorda TaxID=448386 RepID=A0A2V3ITN1_9FLOR|nr:hypothetical protein BWQ96_04781 [Gracilariopsis chorda]|eukprot:PXF45483.1 hypothetical protein BWQ96_04781 [Gracilariopsis chorda]
MNFSADALEAATAAASAAPPPPAPPSTAPAPHRRERQTERIHYTNEFHIYQKARANGSGFTKRARCNHCENDWAFNETRLKHHITDPYRGCRRVPPEVRERIRAADAQNAGTSAASLRAAAAAAATSTLVQNTAVAATQAAIHAPLLGTHISPHQPLPPTKRKREASLTNLATPTTTAQQLQGAHSEAEIGVHLPPSSEAHSPLVAAAGGSTLGTNSNNNGTDVRVAVEFSMTSGGLLRATWIASELISEFHRDILDVGLIPRTSENTFNIWIGGKIAWSRGVGQPLPDYDHLRPIIRNQCCAAAAAAAAAATVGTNGGAPSL